MTTMDDVFCRRIELSSIDGKSVEILQVRDRELLKSSCMLVQLVHILDPVKFLIPPRDIPTFNIKNNIVAILRRIEDDEQFATTIYLFSELNSDVGGVVWDSALVVSHYFIKHSDRWKGLKILEVGSGTGVCGIVLSCLGANVQLTDLSNRLELIHKNVERNKEVINGQVVVEELDWSNHAQLPCVDLLLLVDCVYYVDSVVPLVETILKCPTKEVLCVYEKRDIGEPVAAQQLFDNLISQHFDVKPIPEDELDEDYCCSEQIPIYYLIRK